MSIGMLQGYVQEQMKSAGFISTGWAAPVLTIANLAGFRGPEARTQEVKAILDRPLVRLKKGVVVPGDSFLGEKHQKLLVYNGTSHCNR